MDAELREYLKQIMPDASADCSRCRKVVAAGSAVEGSEGIYCSDTCKMQSEGLLIKKQPKAVIVDGWQV